MDNTNERLGPRFTQSFYEVSNDGRSGAAGLLSGRLQFKRRASIESDVAVVGREQARVIASLISGCRILDGEVHSITGSHNACPSFAARRLYDPGGTFALSDIDEARISARAHGGSVFIPSDPRHTGSESDGRVIGLGRSVKDQGDRGARLAILRGSDLSYPAVEPGSRRQHIPAEALARAHHLGDESITDMCPTYINGGL
jgi:hypothetical protein